MEESNECVHLLKKPHDTNGLLLNTLEAQFFRTSGEMLSALESMIELKQNK
jgi:hypothetical protein